MDPCQAAGYGIHGRQQRAAGAERQPLRFDDMVPYNAFSGARRRDVSGTMAITLDAFSSLIESRDNRCRAVRGSSEAPVLEPSTHAGWVG